MRQTQRFLAVLALGLLTVFAVSAQEIRTVDNPYQEELAYQVGNDLRPQVVVDNLRWRLLKVEPKEGKELVAGTQVQTTVILELENQGDSGAEVLAVILLEDERGSQLARLECKKMRIRSGRIEEEKTKLKVDGGALKDTRKIWVYLEVTR